MGFTEIGMAGIKYFTRRVMNESLGLGAFSM